MAGLRGDHERCEGADHEVGAAEVGAHQFVPVGGVHISEGLAEEADAGVIDEDVAATVLGFHGVGEGVDGGLVEEIELGNVGGAAGVLDVFLDLRELRLVAGGQDDGGSHGGKLFADGCADAACGSGNDGDLAFEFFGPVDLDAAQMLRMNIIESIDRIAK